MLVAATGDSNTCRHGKLAPVADISDSVDWQSWWRFRLMHHHWTTPRLYTVNIPAGKQGLRGELMKNRHTETSCPFERTCSVWVHWVRAPAGGRTNDWLLLWVNYFWSGWWMFMSFIDQLEVRVWRILGRWSSLINQAAQRGRIKHPELHFWNISVIVKYFTLENQHIFAN